MSVPPPKEEPAGHRTYFGRYYVLTVFSLMCGQQNLAWLTFGPVTKEAKEYYGLTDIELTLLPTYSPICFVILTIPFVWFLQKFGLRVTGISGAWILAIGCTIRVFIPYVPEASRWIWVMHVGHILIGYAGLPAMILPPEISSVWFRPKERTLSTAISVTAPGLGQAVGFVMIAYITRQYGIRTMLEVQAEISIFIAILMTIYFPPGPPTPPSISAEKERTDFIKSFKKMACNLGFLMLVVAGGIGMGIPSGFQSVLTIILNNQTGANFDEKVVVHSFNDFVTSTSWIGFTTAVFSTIIGQLLGFFADRFQRKFKYILVVLLLLATGFYLWFSLSLYGWGSLNAINLFFTFCAAIVVTFSAMPIIYEAIVEASYPVAEGTSGGMFPLAMNIGTLIFSVIGIGGVFSDKHPERARAMTWVATGASAFALLLVIFYPQHYERLTVDTKGDEVKDSTETDPLLPSQTKPGMIINNIQK